MVIDGVVGTVVVARPEYLPSLAYGGDLTAAKSRGTVRTRVLARPGVPVAVRPQLGRAASHRAGGRVGGQSAYPRIRRPE